MSAELPEGFNKEQVESLVSGAQRYLGASVLPEPDEDYYYANGSNDDADGGAGE